jgi:hypothetical protein
VVKNSILAVTAKEKWTEEYQDQKLEEVRGSVQELLKWAAEGRRAAAIAKWTQEVHKIVSTTRERAEEVLEE